MITNKLQYNPDVLDALANLSNDEVFTPPKVANEMLDLLPNEIWSDSSIKILDPASKSGVFLREAAKRFIKGLEDEIPDLQERINHIMTKQLFGIGITNLTSLLSRRSLYCSKNAKYDPNDNLGKYSICTEFLSSDGNIRFGRVEHEWQNGNCIHCGAIQREYERESGLESHAYKFIHTKFEEIYDLFDSNKEMRFDVVVGNPPYQLADGGSGASATAIYNKFVEQAKRLNPKYLTMIIPSRRMSGGKGLDSFRENMMNDDSLSILVDYPNSSECFTGVDIAGGVCYFLRDSSYHGKCHVITCMGGNKTESDRKLNTHDVFVRWKEGEDILKKVLKKDTITLDTVVSFSRPFGLRTFFDDYVDEPTNSTYKLYLSSQTGQRKIKYVEKKYITRGEQYINKWKVLMPKAYRLGSVTDGGYVHPIIAEPGSVCTETFNVISSFDTEKEAENFVSYIKTKFFRFLVYLHKTTQDASSKVYRFVPVQDCKKARTDEELYSMYDLNKEEINFIESMINPMD